MKKIIFLFFCFNNCFAFENKQIEAELNNVLICMPKELNNLIAGYASFDYEQNHYVEFLNKLDKKKHNNKKKLNKHNVELLKKMLPEVRQLRKKLQMVHLENFPLLNDYINLEIEICYRIQNTKWDIDVRDLDNVVNLFYQDYKHADEDLLNIFRKIETFDFRIMQRVKRLIIFLLIKNPNSIFINELIYLYEKIYFIISYNSSKIQPDYTFFDGQSQDEYVETSLKNLNIENQRQEFMETHKIYFE